MDFFAHQDDARRQSTLLVVYFVLAVALIVLAVYAAVIGILFYASEGQALGESRSLWHPEIFKWVVGGTVAIIAIGTLFKLQALSKGGAVVAEQLGGRPIARDTADPLERRILNVVDEMAIASGTPVPPVYLLEREAGINAFAAGLSPSDAVIGVTRGSVEKLNRDELQGVIAHEFSHVLNGDMRLNLRLIGVLHGILMIAIVGRILLQTGHHGSRRRREGGGLALVGLALLAIGFIGVIFGRLIKSAVSRQRELLADASGVQFTRNASGLAGALKKIGGFVAGSSIQSPRAEETSHLFFGNAFLSAFGSWMDTHPPLPERIRRLDPSFEGELPEVAVDFVAAPEETAGIASLAPTPPAPTPERAPLTPETVVARAGQTTPESVSRAATIVADLPPSLATAARDREGARAVVLALLLDHQPEVRKRQMEAVRQSMPPAVFQRILDLFADVVRLPPEARLALLDLTLPALRSGDAHAADELRQVVGVLVRADRRLDLFELALERALVRHMPGGKRRRRRPGAKQTYAALSVVLSALAHHGSRGSDDAAHAFRAAVRTIEGRHPPMELGPSSACDADALDPALDALAATPPFVKRMALRACSAAVLADENVEHEEIEILRAVGDALECPIPLLTEASR